LQSSAVLEVGGSGRIDPLAAPRSCVARHRQWGALEAGIGHLGARRPQNHQHLCACPTWRKQRPVFEDEVLALSPVSTRYLSSTAVQQFRETSHSITSSARASSGAGTMRPSVFAVLRLIASCSFVGCSTGSSLGFAPRSILST